MALLTATPNPIGIYKSGSGSTMVHWDTEDRAAGIVYHSIDGSTEKKLGGDQDTGALAGDLPLNLQLGQSCRLSLKRASDISIELQSLMVTTYDIRLELAEGFSQAYLPQLRPQMITNLKVTPGVDTVGVSFRTTRPTIPTIGLFDANGMYLDGRMPLFGGLQTKHGAEFGVDRPLALGSEHKIVIDAFGATGNASAPNKVTETVAFVSGTRSADVAFEHVDVHDDGDSGMSGAGEIVFSFGVGDRSTGALIGESVQFPSDDVAYISDDNGHVDIGVTLPIPVAPRIIWAQVIATDDDSGTLPGQEAVRFFLEPESEEDGSRFFERLAAAHASVTVTVDLGTDSGRFAVPFDMATGDFPLDYVMSGHIFVRAKDGAVIATKAGKGRLPWRRSSFLTEPGEGVRLTADGKADHGYLIALGADGAVHHLPLNPEHRAKQKSWTRVELPFAGTISIAASPDGALNLFGLDADGGVQHGRADPGRAGKAKWRRLGGKFREIRPLSPGAKTKDARLPLVGIGRDDSLYVADATDDRASWDKMIDGSVRAVAAISVPDQPDAILALGESGAITHIARQRGRWRTQRHSARWPGKALPQALSTAMIETVDTKSRSSTRDLMVAALSEDLSVRLLRWADYPSETPDLRWEEIGSAQDLLRQTRSSRAAQTSRANVPKKATKSKRRRT